MKPKGLVLEVAEVVEGITVRVVERTVVSVVQGSGRVNLAGFKCEVGRFWQDV